MYWLDEEVRDRDAGAISHLSRKNKDAAKVGHPSIQRVGASAGEDARTTAGHAAGGTLCGRSGL
jgi:hypothetical protein